MKQLIRIFSALLAFLPMVALTSCDYDADSALMDGKPFPGEEGDEDETDLFMIPLDNSGPSDQRELDRLRKLSQEEQNKK